MFLRRIDCETYGFFPVTTAHQKVESKSNRRNSSFELEFWIQCSFTGSSRVLAGSVVSSVFFYCYFIEMSLVVGRWWNGWISLLFIFIIIILTVVVVVVVVGRSSMRGSRSILASSGSRRVCLYFFDCVTDDVVLNVNCRFLLLTQSVCMCVGNGVAGNIIYEQMIN